MRLALLVALLLLAPNAVLAAGGGKKDGAKPEPGHVDVSTIAAPVIIDGRVVNYVFVQVRLLTDPSVQATEMKAKEPRLREALVRAAHRKPWNPADDRSAVDPARVAAVALAEARRIGGPKSFIGAQVRTQTPQRRLPKVAANP